MLCYLNFSSANAVIYIALFIENRITFDALRLRKKNNTNCSIRNSNGFYPFFNVSYPKNLSINWKEQKKKHYWILLFFTRKELEKQAKFLINSKEKEKDVDS